MKTLKHLFLGFVLLAGLSLGVSAQKNDDQKKPPKKDPPPTVNPNPRGEKPPPRQDPPRDKPKKPGSEYSIVWVKGDGDVA